MANTNFENTIEGSRKVERPRLKWLEDVENDLREILVKRLRENNREQKYTYLSLRGSRILEHLQPGSK
jgi:hypothetical protein